MAAARASRTAGGLPADLIEFILLGPEDDRRQLQDSPLLGDVWLAYADAPARAHDLLVTPHREVTAPKVAMTIKDRLGDRRGGDGRAGIAFLQGIVAVRLSFSEVLRVLAPMTEWWSKRDIASTLAGRLAEDELEGRLSELVEFVVTSLQGDESAGPASRFDPLDRFLTLAGLILWALEPRPAAASRSADAVLEAARDDVDAIAALVRGALGGVETPPKPLVFQVSRNRRAGPALEHSVPAVKADAARTLFSVSCKKIAWAVLDSGIETHHEAFRGAGGKSRVVATYDFSRIRDIVSIDNDTLSQERVKELAERSNLSQKQVREHLDEVRKDAEEERPVDWNRVAKLITLGDPPSPTSIHGTHVAGILGAKAPEGSAYSDGMCPDIRLFDFRVLSKTLEETEFAVIAALQYIRFINEQHGYITIHGANLSLSIPHSVRNYACGFTPICSECERLAESGVSLVAAAGNHGYQKFKTNDGVYEGYAAFSITDPGNAEAVITVGATHPRAPHNYGVSFFSSRGPTGDGRLKPDLVAPGERIQAPIAGPAHNEWGEESGTSMAAPHVSGAAAMLMARYSELVGQPRRIKEILCQSATDLGRERSFQGYGMLDVLRAFQSI